VAEYDAVREEVRKLLAMPMAKHWPTFHADPAGELDRARPDPLHPERTGGQSPTHQDSLYDPETEQAIKQFQRRHGLTADGIIGRQTRSWLNTGPEVRASLLVRNLWRRDLVDHLAGRYVLVNIPDYRLSVVESGSEVFTSRVIVGKEQRATPILASEIRSIVLNPAWHVPRSILSKDILPKLGRDPAYLDREQFEVIDGEGNPVQFSEDGWHHALASGFPYRLRQKPGITMPWVATSSICPTTMPSISIPPRARRCSSRGPVPSARVASGWNTPTIWRSCCWRTPAISRTRWPAS
jgi:murein L,D-transpeptidase YcbB/YkuD